MMVFQYVFSDFCSLRHIPWSTRADAIKNCHPGLLSIRKSVWSVLFKVVQISDVAILHKKYLCNNKFCVILNL